MREFDAIGSASKVQFPNRHQVKSWACQGLDPGVDPASAANSDGEVKAAGGPRILLWDDHLSVSQSLRVLLEREGFCVVGEASDAQEAARLAAEAHAAVAILNFFLPVSEGENPYRTILDASPETKLVMLTQPSAEMDVLQAMRAGVRAYVARSESSADLIRAIREVLRGNIYLSPSLAKIVVRFFRAADVSGDVLTTRERQVVQLIAEGMSAKEIADLLGISQRTAESHRNRAMQKLDIHDVAGIVRYAIRNGLIQP
jgi:DNA-binding NarL/FixJ family response regulator